MRPESLRKRRHLQRRHQQLHLHLRVGLDRYNACSSPLTFSKKILCDVIANRDGLRHGRERVHFESVSERRNLQQPRRPLHVHVSLRVDRCDANLIVASMFCTSWLRLQDTCARMTSTSVCRRHANTEPPATTRKTNTNASASPATKAPACHTCRTHLQARNTCSGRCRR